MNRSHETMTLLQSRILRKDSQICARILSAADVNEAVQSAPGLSSSCVSVVSGVLVERRDCLEEG